MTANAAMCCVSEPYRPDIRNPMMPWRTRPIKSWRLGFSQSTVKAPIKLPGT